MNMDLYLKQVHFKNHKLECPLGCEAYGTLCNGDANTTPCSRSIEIDKHGKEVTPTLPIEYVGTYDNSYRYCLIVTDDIKGLIVEELPFRDTNGTRIYSVAIDCITVEAINLVAAGKLSFEDAIDDSCGGSISGNKKNLLSDKDIPKNHIPYIKECIDYLSKSAMQRENKIGFRKE